MDEDKPKGLALGIRRDGLNETIEAIADIVNAGLMDDKEYAAMGKNPLSRVKTLLGKLDDIRRSKERI